MHAYADAYHSRMRALSKVCVFLCCAGTVAATAGLTIHHPATLLAESARCTMRPGAVMAVLRVEKDTILSFAPVGVDPMSFSGVREGPHDTLLAIPGTPMPAARVRLLQLDSTTRRILTDAGITETQPVAFIKAAPYRADCRAIRWTDTIPFAVRGEMGYVRATLAPRDRWIGDMPLLIIPDTWYYPYPRRRSLAFGSAANATLAPADAMFALETTFQPGRGGWIATDSATRARVIEWVRANAAVADLEPVRRSVRQAVLDADWRAAAETPSRLRGTYRVELEAGGQRATWYFRTNDKPGYAWREDSLQTMAQLLAFPHVGGYRLVGHAASLADSLPVTSPRPRRMEPLVWFVTNDMPTAPGNAARSTLRGFLEFRMNAAPEPLWNDLEAFVPRRSVMDSTMLARTNLIIKRDEKQPQLPITVVFDDRGGVRADTTLYANGRTLRVVLRRIDTLSVRRPF